MRCCSNSRVCFKQHVICFTNCLLVTIQNTKTLTRQNLRGYDDDTDDNVEQLLHAQSEQRGESYQYEQAGATPHHYRARLPLRGIDVAEAQITVAAHRDLVIPSTDSI